MRLVEKIERNKIIYVHPPAQHAPGGTTKMLSLDPEGRLRGLEEHFKHPTIQKKNFQFDSQAFSIIFYKNEINFNFVGEIPSTMDRHKKKIYKKFIFFAKMPPKFR